MTKLTIIGAGSAVFTKNIFTDLMFIDDFKKMDIALVDIDEKRLKISHELLDVIAKKLNASPNIKSYTNRKEALAGSDFVQSTIQVGGYKPSTVIDFDIPNQFGLKQTIADTLGIGGIMRGLRTIPVLVDIGKDIMDLCPNSLWLQYVNPMCSNMIAINNACPGIKSIGLCHSVQGTAEDLAKDIGEDIKNISYECSGINHMSFFTKFEKINSDGTKENLYPKIFKAGKEKTFGTNWDGCTNEVRYKVLEKLGYFVTESSEHFAEYTPWFIKNNREDLLSEFNIPINEYIRRCKKQIKEWDRQEQSLLNGEKFVCKKSLEYASRIIVSIVDGKEDTINGNVINNKLISNLPEDCCVEVPCKINNKGINPQKVDNLPMHLANLMKTNINVQQLTVEALKTKKKETVYHAAMLDPLTSSVLSLDQISSMVDELLIAHKNWIPVFN